MWCRWWQTSDTHSSEVIVHPYCNTCVFQRLQTNSKEGFAKALKQYFCNSLLDASGVCDSLRITFAVLRAAWFLVQLELLQTVYYLYGNWELHLENIQWTADCCCFFCQKSQDLLKPWQLYLVMESILQRKNKWPLILIVHYCLMTSYILYISFCHLHIAVIVSLSNHEEFISLCKFVLKLHVLSFSPKLPLNVTGIYGEFVWIRKIVWRSFWK